MLLFSESKESIKIIFLNTCFTRGESTWKRYDTRIVVLKSSLIGIMSCGCSVNLLGWARVAQSLYLPLPMCLATFKKIIIMA